MSQVDAYDVSNPEPAQPAAPEGAAAPSTGVAAGAPWPPSAPPGADVPDDETLWGAAVLKAHPPRDDDDAGPWFAAATLSEGAWQALLDTWWATLPEVDDAVIADLDDAQLRRLLHAFGFSDDLDRLRRSAEGQRSARAWLRQCTVTAVLSDTGRAFAEVHAPALWRRLAPGADCLEQVHIEILRDWEQLEARPQALCQVARLVQLLPPEVRTTGQADRWLGPDSDLGLWLAQRAEAPVTYLDVDDRDMHALAASAVDHALARFADEPPETRRAWELLRLKLLWRLGRVEEARTDLYAFMRATPERADADIAWATAVSGGGGFNTPDVAGLRAGLAVLARAAQRRLRDDDAHEVALVEAELRDQLDMLTGDPDDPERGMRLMKLLMAQEPKGEGLVGLPGGGFALVGELGPSGTPFDGPGIDLSDPAVRARMAQGFEQLH